MCYCHQALPIGSVMKNINKPTLLICASVLAATFLLPYSKVVYAHKVNMFAYSDGPNIFIEGYFSDGHKAQNSVVTVFDPAGKQLLQGTTDDKGQFSFPIPEKTDLRVVLNAGMGHRTEYVIKANEISDDVDMSSAADSDAADADTATNNPVNEASPSSDQPSNRELKVMIETAVGQSIKPLMREVSEMKERRGFSDIVGGIGFIFGIIGVVFYMKARKGMSKQTKNV